MSEVEKIGNIGGKAIYADSGQDYAKLLLEEIRKNIERKEVRVGQVFMMPFDFGIGNPLIARIEIQEWNDK